MEVNGPIHLSRSSLRLITHELSGFIGAAQSIFVQLFQEQADNLSTQGCLEYWLQKFKEKVHVHVVNILLVQLQKVIVKQRFLPLVCFFVLFCYSCCDVRGLLSTSGRRKE